MKVRNLLILGIILIFNYLASSQLKEILVLNEGSYDYVSGKILVPVTVGVYDIVGKAYQQVNIIDNARFASDIIIDKSNYWIAADQSISKFDLLSHQLLASMNLVGVRKLAIYNDLLIVTRGEYLKKLEAYIQIYNKNSFKLLFEIPASDLPYTTESIVIKDSHAYIAVNNGFDFGNEVGKIVKLNLNTLQVEAIVDLGTEGKNPENLMIKDNLLLSLNNKSFNGSSVSLFNLENAAVESYNLNNVNSLCGTSVLSGESIIYQEINKTEVGKFKIADKQSGVFKDLGHSFYGMNFDPKSKLLCAGETDFKTTGKVHVYDEQFNENYLFDAGVAPGYFAFVDASLLASRDVQALEFDISPNPVVSKIRIICQEAVVETQVLDFCGKLLAESNQKSIDIESLQAGVYLLCVKSRDHIGYKRFVKRAN